MEEMSSPWDNRFSTPECETPIECQDSEPQNSDGYGEEDSGYNRDVSNSSREKYNENFNEDPAMGNKEFEIIQTIQRKQNDIESLKYVVEFYKKLIDCYNSCVSNNSVLTEINQVKVRMRDLINEKLNEIKSDHDQLESKLRSKDMVVDKNQIEKLRKSVNDLKEKCRQKKEYLAWLKQQQSNVKVELNPTEIGILQKEWNKKKQIEDDMKNSLKYRIMQLQTKLSKLDDIGNQIDKEHIEVYIKKNRLSRSFVNFQRSSNQIDKEYRKQKFLELQQRNRLNLLSN